MKSHGGHFWGVLETRPYMRARQGLADTLWRLDRRDEARSHYEEMLRLNPNDNQGIRYLLVMLLLEMDLRCRRGETAEPVSRRAHGHVALHSRRCSNSAKAAQPTKPTRRFRRRSSTTRTCRLILTGQKRIPNRLPDHIGFGDENEAVAYAADHLNHWRRTEGAVDWLQEQLGPIVQAGQGRRNHPSAKEPTLDQVVESLLAEVDGPVPLDDLVQQVLARRPSKAKNPVQAVTNHIRELVSAGELCLSGSADGAAAAVGVSRRLAFASRSTGRW